MRRGTGLPRDLTSRVLHAQATGSSKNDFSKPPARNVGGTSEPTVTAPTQRSHPAAGEIVYANAPYVTGRERATTANPKTRALRTERCRVASATTHNGRPTEPNSNAWYGTEGGERRQKRTFLSLQRIGHRRVARAAPPTAGRAKTS